LLAGKGVFPIEEEESRATAWSMGKGVSLLCGRGCCTDSKDGNGTQNPAPNYRDLQYNEISFINDYPDQRDEFHEM